MYKPQLLFTHNDPQIEIQSSVIGLTDSLGSPTDQEYSILMIYRIAKALEIKELDAVSCGIALHGAFMNELREERKNLAAAGQQLAIETSMSQAGGSLPTQIRDLIPPKVRQALDVLGLKLVVAPTRPPLKSAWDMPDEPQCRR